MGQKQRLLGLRPCRPTGQLNPDERTERVDAGAIQNLVVRHGGMACMARGLPRQQRACGAEHRGSGGGVFGHSR
jgi:hypothetical protein